MMTPLVSAAQVAEWLDVHEGHLWRLVKAGVLPAPIRLGKKKGPRRWTRDEIEAAVLKRRDRRKAKAAEETKPAEEKPAA